MCIHKFTYSAEDVDCKLCTEHFGRNGCRQDFCPYYAERIEAGVISYGEAVSSLIPSTSSIRNRLPGLIHSFPGSLWADEKHETRMKVFDNRLGFIKSRNTPSYAAQKAGRSTVEGSARAAKEAAKKSEQAATFVARHRKGFAAVLGILLILAFLLNAVSSCSMMVEGIGAGIAAGSYAAADDDIVGAEAAYCAMEQALQRQLDRYEQTHDYDEYHYELDDIGHDPYVLTAILSAMHPGEWTLPQVMLCMSFLTITASAEANPPNAVLPNDPELESKILGLHPKRYCTICNAPNPVFQNPDFSKI